MNTCQHCGMPSVAGHVCASGGQLKIVYGVVPDPRDAEIAALRAQLAEARKVIEELVTLNDMKLHHHVSGLWNSSAVEEDYYCRKPVAWEAARAFLARKEEK